MFIVDWVIVDWFVPDRFILDRFILGGQATAERGLHSLDPCVFALALGLGTRFGIREDAQMPADFAQFGPARRQAGFIGQSAPKFRLALGREFTVEECGEIRVLRPTVGGDGRSLAPGETFGFLGGIIFSRSRSSLAPRAAYFFSFCHAVFPLLAMGPLDRSPARHRSH